MKPVFQTYLDNLAVVQKLVKPQFPDDISGEELIRRIRADAERIARIHQENDLLLQEELFSKKAETLTEEEARELSELADALFNFNRSPDVGIAYRVHRLLYEYACFHQNADLMVRELYYQGVTLVYLNVRMLGQGINMFLDQIGECFQAGAAYLDRYDELTSSETRSYIIRCLGNLKYGLKSFQGRNDGKKSSANMGESWQEYMDCFRRTMEIVENPHYQKMNPEIPWDTFAYSMHYDRTQFLTALREKDDPAIAGAVLESARYVYQHQEQIAKEKEKSLGARTRYVYAAARYHAGLIPVQELIDVLFDMFETADLHDFSGDTIWVCLYVPEYLARYIEDLPLREQPACKARLQDIFERQREYLFLLPQNEYAMQVSRTLQSISEEASTRDPGISRKLLEYILACHPPTFIHSEMVARLCRRFCERMLDTRPELMNGVFGFENAVEHREDILERAYRSGLYHDLGKCMLLRYVAIYSRRLLDEEFDCIKLHTVFGCSLLENLGMEEMSSAAYYHHRSYDGRAGYPQCAGECASSIRPIVDIITVADSLDAGTDNVGRSYSAAKTYSQLVEELRAGKNVRYSPQVVELLDDPAFCRETEEFLTQSRLEVYQQIYRVH